MADGRVNGSLNLSRALGDMEYKQSTDLAAEDQIVTAVPEVSPSPQNLLAPFAFCLTGPFVSTFIAERLRNGYQNGCHVVHSAT